MDDIFMMDKKLMREVINAIKSLHVTVNDFNEADKWVGIIMILENAMNPPIPKKTESITIEPKIETVVNTENGSDD